MDLARPPDWNMSLDEAILEGVEAGESPPTLRLYQWDRNCISIGRFQSWKSAQELAEGRPELPIVRRPTGGRGVRHGADLTVSLAVPVQRLGLDPSEEGSVRAIYARLAQLYLLAFRRMRIAAVQGECGTVRRERAADCFQSSCRADIAHGPSGRKLLGSALSVRKGTILQQTSIPLDGLRLVHSAGDGSVSDFELLRKLSFRVMEAARELLPGDWKPGEAGTKESLQAAELSKRKYTQEAWTRDGRYN